MTSNIMDNKILPNRQIRPTLTIQEAQFLKYCLVQSMVRGWGIDWAYPLGQLLSSRLTDKLNTLLEEYYAEESH